mmetsp:Transcript_5182/g.11441  ORF Transcript_5182/g.11441 Transcript_5182/m.11441 type:complete len:202 (+) Transcript_5182:110-715(+)
MNRKNVVSPRVRRVSLRKNKTDVHPVEFGLSDTLRVFSPQKNEQKLNADKWLLRDRLAVYEQYCAVPPWNNGENDQINKGEAPAQVLRDQAFTFTGFDECNITPEVHRETLKKAINRQTIILTKEFTHRLKRIQANHDSQRRRLELVHKDEVEFLATQIKEGIIRENELKARITKHLTELAVLNQAYKDLREDKTPQLTLG